MAIRWEKLTVKSQQAMQQAQERAAELGNPEILPIHLLLALVEDREGVIPAVLGKIGVPAERLATISYGQERPVCTDHDENCWQKNRRAHLSASN